MSIKAEASKLITVYHPGVTLAEKLKEMGMSVKEFAVRVSKPEKTIFAVINGSSSITTEMAVSFEAVTKIPASFWLRKQQMYDEFVVRKKREEEAKASIAWMKLFPYLEMVKRGWIAAVKTPEEKVRNLFEYFGVSTEKAWADYYLNPGGFFGGFGCIILHSGFHHLLFFFIKHRESFCVCRLSLHLFLLPASCRLFFRLPVHLHIKTFQRIKQAVRFFPDPGGLFQNTGSLLHQTLCCIL